MVAFAASDAYRDRNLDVMRALVANGRDAYNSVS